MTSTEKRYKTDNLPVLHTAMLRGEYLYFIRIYKEKANFQSIHSGVVRMRMLLAFIEVRATVVDALIKTDENLQYLSLICSSAANPQIFSRIMKKTVPEAIIEEINRENAEKTLSFCRDYGQEDTTCIPFARAIHTVHESRDILFVLLLEYRALLTDYAEIMNVKKPGVLPDMLNEYRISFLMFQQDSAVCGIPATLVERINNGANNAYILELRQTYGLHALICEDVFSVKDIDVQSLVFNSKVKKGTYAVSCDSFDFNLVIPSLFF